MKTGLLMISCALSSLLVASQAHAALVGNPLIHRDRDSDEADYVYDVYYGSPMPSDGMVDFLEIYQQQIGISLTVRLLRYTGSGNLYNQYFVSPVLTTFGSTETIQGYSLGGEIPVQAGDLFVVYGRGVPFDMGVSTPDEIYYNGNNFAPPGPDAALIDLTTANFTDHRIYSAALNFIAAAGTSPAPEPSTLAALGVGASLLLLRKKRY